MLQTVCRVYGPRGVFEGVLCIHMLDVDEAPIGPLSARCQILYGGYARQRSSIHIRTSRQALPPYGRV